MTRYRSFAPSTGAFVGRKGSKCILAHTVSIATCNSQLLPTELNMRIAIIPEENKKSEPFSNRKQVRIFLVWWARVDHAEPHKGREPGLRFPASASCLGRHGRPADRSPNGSSLFPPLGGGRRRCPLGCFCAVFSDVAAAVRIHPPALLKAGGKTKSSTHLSTLSFFGGRGWIAPSRTSKKAPRGFFPRRTFRRVDVVRIHPWLRFVRF